jgi:cytochrome c oxidase cbb3-type subunit III
MSIVPRTFLLVTVIAFVVLAGLVVLTMAPAEPRVSMATESATPLSEDQLRALPRDPDVVREGALIYAKTCNACHGVHGEGGLGPNLRDDAWLHGSDMARIVTAIAEGNRDQGMAPWKYSYSPSQLRAVAAYVVTLTGGREGIDKAAEGEHAPISYWP